MDYTELCIGILNQLVEDWNKLVQLGVNQKNLPGKPRAISFDEMRRYLKSTNGSLVCATIGEDNMVILRELERRKELGIWNQ